MILADVALAAASSHLPARSSRRSDLRAASPTRTSAAASARAVARPMPEGAPVLSSEGDMDF